MRTIDWTVIVTALITALPITLGAAATLRNTNRKVDAVAAQVKPSNGATLATTVEKIEAQQRSLAERVDNTNKLVRTHIADRDSHLERRGANRRQPPESKGRRA